MVSNIVAKYFKIFDPKQKSPLRTNRPEGVFLKILWECCTQFLSVFRYSAFRQLETRRSSVH